MHSERYFLCRLLRLSTISDITHSNVRLSFSFLFYRIVLASTGSQNKLSNYNRRPTSRSKCAISIGLLHTVWSILSLQCGTIRRTLSLLSVIVSCSPFNAILHARLDGTHGCKYSALRFGCLTKSLRFRNVKLSVQSVIYHF